MRATTFRRQAAGCVPIHRQGGCPRDSTLPLTTDDTAADTGIEDHAKDDQHAGRRTVGRLG